MKEARFQNQLQMAQGARDAAVQTIAGGIGNIGSAAIYGFDNVGYNNPDPTRQGFSKKARDLRKADRLAAMEEGGKVMKTPGEFSHKTNPIDIMRNGKKIAEATGGEYIFNPKQMSNIKKYVATDDKSKLHSYVKALIKRFEK